MTQTTTKGANDMNTYKNKNFTKRNYECTNVIACQGEQAPNENYVLTDDSILKGLTPLWIENNVRYFGHL